MEHDPVRPRPRRSSRVPVVLLLLVAFALRAAWGLAQPTDAAAIDRLPDQREYLELARSLLDGQGLKFYDPRFGDEVYAFRTPAYPAFVAACGANVRLVRLAQAFLDASTVLAVYLLTRRWLPPRGALIAGAIAAFNPFLIYFTGLLLTETLFTALLVWGMALVVGVGRAARLRDPDDVGDAQDVADEGTADGTDEPAPPRASAFPWLFGGLLLALAVLVRQSAAALPVVLGIAGAFANRGQGAAYHRRWPLPVGSTMLLLTLLVLAPWAYRNSRVIGTWVWTTTNGGITAYDGFHPDATGASDQSFVAAMPQLRAMGEVGRSNYLGEQAKRFVREHPARAAQLAVVKAGRTWSPVPLSAEYGGRKYWVIGLLYSVPLDLLVLVGLRRGRLGRAAKAFLLLPAIYFTIVHALSVGSLRYRVPAEPPLAVIAASALATGGRSGIGAWKRAGSEAAPA